MWNSNNKPSVSTTTPTTNSDTPTVPQSNEASPSSWLTSNERVSIYPPTDTDNNKKKNITNNNTVSHSVRIQGEKILVREIMTIVQRTKKQVVQYYGSSSGSSTVASSDTSSDAGDRTSTSTVVGSSGGLTHLEQDVFSRYTYYGYKYGISAGFLSFTILYGGLRFSAYRRWRGVPNPLSEQYHPNLVSRRQQYTIFDRQQQQQQQKQAADIVTTASSGGNRKVRTAVVNETKRQPQHSQSIASSSPAAATTTSTLRNTTTTTIKPTTITLFTTTTSSSSFALFPNDVAVTVQLYIAAAISLFIAVKTWNYTFDWDTLHDQVASLPLQSGTSTYCQLLCQELLHRQQQIVHGDMVIPITTMEREVSGKQTTMSGRESLESTHTNVRKTNDGTSDQSLPPQSQQQPSKEKDDESSVTVKIVQLSTSELWEDPLSENLQRMKRLVMNCEQRTMYEKECIARQQRHQEEKSRQPTTDVVDGDTTNHNPTTTTIDFVVNVPEPSLPLRYHSIPSSKIENTTTATNV